MDNDIKKLIGIILLSVILIGLPIGYVAYKYREKILRIDEAEVITLPEEVESENNEKGNESSAIIKTNETVVYNIFDKTDTETPTEEVEDVEEIIKDPKEGLIKDNSLKPTEDDQTIQIGPTTGKMGSTVNVNDPSGFKRELEQNVFQDVGKLKRDPARVPNEYIMAYFSDDNDEKAVFSTIKAEIDKVASGEKTSAVVPQAIQLKDKDYIITTMETWKIETPYNNREGIMNEIKLEAPDFLRATLTPDNGAFAYGYGAVSLFFNTEKNKNIIVMSLYNFALVDK